MVVKKELIKKKRGFEKYKDFLAEKSINSDTLKEIYTH